MNAEGADGHKSITMRIWFKQKVPIRSVHCSMLVLGRRLIEQECNEQRTIETVVIGTTEAESNY